MTIAGTKGRILGIPIRELCCSCILTPAFVGHAHNRMNRTIAEYQQLGYTVCGTITTHLEAIDP
jgi:hypothetical protein